MARRGLNRPAARPLSRAVRNSESAFPEELVGRVIANRYLVEERTEETPASARYRAYHIALDRSVCLQILRDRAGLTREACRRALARAEQASAASVPQLMRTLDVGWIDGRWPFVVGELSRGRSLQRLLADRGAPGPLALLPLAIQAARALAAAHAAGVVHGALTLDDLWLEMTDRGRPEALRISGFGLCELPPCQFEGSSSGVFQTCASGTLTSASHRAESSGVRADLRGLGNVLYELATGKRPPWSTGDASAAPDLDMLAGSWGALGALARGLGTVMQRCCHALPHGHYASMDEARRDLERIAAAASHLREPQRAASPPVTAVHVPAPRQRAAAVAGPKVIVQGH